jgi:hypothetical protein
MSEFIPSSCRWPRYTHEYISSLNLVWAIVWFKRETTKQLVGNVIEHYLAAFWRKALQLVSPIGGRTILDQLMLSFFLAIIGLLLLRVLSRFATTNIVLRTIAGAAAIAAFPMATGVYRTGLWVEVIAVLVCVVLYYLRRLSIPLMIPILVFHFVFWAWETSSYYDVSTLVGALRGSEYYHPWARTLGVASFAVVFYFGFPVIGLFASVIWIWYVKCTSAGGLSLTRG